MFLYKVKLVAKNTLNNIHYSTQLQMYHKAS